MDWKKPSQPPKRQDRQKMDGFCSTADSVRMWQHSTSQTTAPPPTQSAPQTACRKTSTPFTPSSRGDTHTYWVWHVAWDPQQLLLLHCWEHLDRLYHCLVRQLLWTAESGKDCRDDQLDSTALSAEHLSPQSPQESYLHPQRPQPGFYPQAGGTEVFSSRPPN